jgi:ligand-binding sensor domain-containing protein
MKRFVLVCFLFLLLLNAAGQINKYGVPFVKTYSTQITHGSEQNWAIARDVFGNMYFGNQDHGVIRYDGTKWSDIQIKNNPRISSLRADEKGIVYVGAYFEFGYIQPDEKGEPVYTSLSERVDSIPNIKVIWSIEEVDGKMLFLGSKFIYVYDVANDSLSEIDLLPFNLIDAFRLVKFHDKLIIADNISGLYEVKGTDITPLKGGDFFARKNCIFMLPYDESQILIGTYFDGLFLYDYSTGTVRDNFGEKNLHDKLQSTNIYAGVVLSKDLYAIGTINQEGIIVIDRSGKIVYQLTVGTSDLNDDSVHAMYCDPDSNSELWVATYGFVNKVYFNVPITKFADKQGIEYGLNDIALFKGSLYLSTDAGILKSYVDNNIVRFRKIPNAEGQFLPLEVVRISNNEYLLSSSLSGLVQVYEDGTIRKRDSTNIDIPAYETKIVETKRIVKSAIDKNILFLGLNQGGIDIIRDEGRRWSWVNRIKGFPGSILSMVENKEGGLWFITDDPSALYNASFNGQDTSNIEYGIEKGVPDVRLWSLCYVDDVLYLTTASGVYRYDKSNDVFIPDNSLTGGFSEGKLSQNIFVDSDRDIFFSGFDTRNFEMLFRTNKGIQAYRGVLNLLPNVTTLDIMENEGMIYLTKSKILYVLDKSRLLPDSTRVNTRFASIIVGRDSVVMKGAFHSHVDTNRRIPLFNSPEGIIPEYRFDMNEIAFEWTTPYFIEELQTEYSYMLEGYDKDWSEWEGISFGFTQEAIYSKKEYTNLPYGHYTFHVRSRTLTGLEGNKLKYEFIILKPWYATILAFIGYAIAAILIIWGIIAAYTRRLKNENIRLEGIVRERTAVVVKQKEELESSIHYAKRIQMALLPSQSILNDNLKENFILFKPRDIVSGDYYWMFKKE